MHEWVRARAPDELVRRWPNKSLSNRVADMRPRWHDDATSSQPYSGCEYTAALVVFSRANKCSYLAAGGDGDGVAGLTRAMMALDESLLIDGVLPESEHVKPSTMSLHDLVSKHFPTSDSISFTDSRWTGADHTRLKPTPGTTSKDILYICTFGILVFLHAFCRFSDTDGDQSVEGKRCARA